MVRRLGDRCVTAVVSGRGRQDVRERVRLDNLFYAGTHGFRYLRAPRVPAFTTRSGKSSSR